MLDLLEARLDPVQLRAVRRQVGQVTRLRPTTSPPSRPSRSRRRKPKADELGPFGRRRMPPLGGPLSETPARKSAGPVRTTPVVLTGPATTWGRANEPQALSFFRSLAVGIG